MRRAVFLIGAGAALLAGLAGAAYAQRADGPKTPSNFKYDIEGNRRVDRPDSKTVAPDGTVRQEYKSGKCVKVREVRPDGAVKTTLKCD